MTKDDYNQLNSSIYESIVWIRKNGTKDDVWVLAAKIMPMILPCLSGLPSTNRLFTAKDIENQALLLLVGEIERFRIEDHSTVLKKPKPFKRKPNRRDPQYKFFHRGQSFTTARYWADLGIWSQHQQDVKAGDIYTVEVLCANFNAIYLFKQHIKRDIIRWLNKNNGFVSITPQTEIYTATHTAETIDAEELLCEVTTRQREVMRLFLEDLNFTEIGKRLDITKQTARKVYLAAIRSLQATEQQTTKEERLAAYWESRVAGLSDCEPVDSANS